MAIWDREDETEWEKYQRSKGKRARRETEGQGGGEAPSGREKRSPADGESPLERLRDLGKRVKDAALGGAEPETGEPPERCPWCGGEMVRGYLRAGQGGGIYWADRKLGLFGTLEGIRVDDEGGLLSYKTAWYCQPCQKLTLDMAEAGDEIPEAVKKTMWPPPEDGAQDGEEHQEE